ncbi:hypothetical protein J31TS4_45680 [Paenibacillus sp. J31TS4]|uniref:TatD family hydrolase n=1 Tax=Paenibacillus sp. J31TS4 TaxID=2807195 RepID=UPI001B252DF1|nr:TatD family hydrolase [Paenibacillus sp. J31TS4]GIP41288.1 hypothetical protein J31TS4_45680 [Paenibacillus sp. J31TS4]
MRYYDAHLHLDDYPEAERERMLHDLPGLGCAGVIAVSKHLASCRTTRELALRHPELVHPAYGFHPEQPLPGEEETEELLAWIRRHAEECVAIGEIGLPYYTRTEAERRGEAFDQAPYLRLLDRLLALAAELGKPVVLHAVYEDAEVACDLLNRHGIRRAHFHWFKGTPSTVDRMIAEGRTISFTPDLLYEEEIRQLAARYPAELTLAETDGPWPFEGPFAGRPTHPAMAADVIHAWAVIRGLSPEEASSLLLANTRRFYGLKD